MPTRIAPISIDGRILPTKGLSNSSETKYDNPPVKRNGAKNQRSFFSSRINTKRAITNQMNPALPTPEKNNASESAKGGCSKPLMSRKSCRSRTRSVSILWRGCCRRRCAFSRCSRWPRPSRGWFGCCGCLGGRFFGGRCRLSRSERSRR